MVGQILRYILKFEYLDFKWNPDSQTGLKIKHDGYGLGFVYFSTQNNIVIINYYPDLDDLV